jgi:hypothetical protein
MGEPDLTLAHKLVLLALETFADYPSGTNAYPGVTRLAETCRLRARAVEAALHQGRGLGLIEQTSRANPKRGLAASYRLVSTRTDGRVDDAMSTRASVRVDEDLAEKQTNVGATLNAPSSGNNEMSARTTLGHPPDVSIRTPVRADRFQSAQNQFQPARNDVSIRTSVQPTKPITLSQSTAAPAPASVHEDVADYLIETAIATRQPRQIRNQLRKQVLRLLDEGMDIDIVAEALQRWGQRTGVAPTLLPHLYSDIVRENTLWGSTQKGRSAELGRRRDCNECDEWGWLLGADGTSLDPASPCTHPGLACAAPVETPGAQQLNRL